jgi:hypothetical protein
MKVVSGGSAESCRKALRPFEYPPFIVQLASVA